MIQFGIIILLFFYSLFLPSLMSAKSIDFMFLLPSLVIMDGSFMQFTCVK